MHHVLYRVIAKITPDPTRRDYWLSPVATGVTHKHRFRDGLMWGVSVRFPHRSGSIKIVAGGSCEVLATITRWDNAEPVREGDTWEIAMLDRVEAHGEVLKIEEVAACIDSYPMGDAWREFMGV
jgi:hypothetical protein